MKHNSCNQKDLKRFEILNIFITLLILAMLVYSLINLGSLETTLKSEIYYYGIPGILLSSILLDFLPQFLSPFIVLATSIFAGFNVHLAILSTILGSTIGSAIGFFLGKKYMFAIVDCLVNPKKVEQVTRLMNKHGKWAVPLTAISPLPYLPLVIGALNFSNKNFIIYGLIPRALGLIIFGYLIGLI